MRRNENAEAVWYDMGGGPRFGGVDTGLLVLLAKCMARLPETVYDWLMDEWDGEALYFHGSLTSVATYPTEGYERITVVFLDRKLQGVPEEAALGVIAHEIAHLRLGHHRFPGWPVPPPAEEFLANEDAADQLAESWGFDVKSYDQFVEGA
jgi:hypothetical protein